MTALCGDLLGCKCQDLNFLGGHLKRASREQIAADKGHLHFSCTTCDPPLDHSRVVLPKSVSINSLTNSTRKIAFQVCQLNFRFQLDKWKLKQKGYINFSCMKFEIRIMLKQFFSDNDCNICFKIFNLPIYTVLRVSILKDSVVHYSKRLYH